MEEGKLNSQIPGPPCPPTSGITNEVIHHYPYILAAYLDTNEDLDDIDDEENEALEDDLPPEVPKRTSSKGVGSVPLASSTSASGRSSAGSLSIRGQVKSVGNGVANDAESQHPRDGPVRICSATGRPLVVSRLIYFHNSNAKLG